MIAHRLSTVLDADRVIVMAEGRVVQQGPPAELLADTGGGCTSWWQTSIRLRDGPGADVVGGSRVGRRAGGLLRGAPFSGAGSVPRGTGGGPVTDARPRAAPFALMVAVAVRVSRALLSASLRSASLRDGLRPPLTPEPPPQKAPKGGPPRGNLPPTSFGGLAGVLAGVRLHDRTKGWWPVRHRLSGERSDPHEGFGGRCDTGSAANRRIRARMR